MAYKKLKYWFDKELAELLSDKILFVYPRFDRRSFSSSIEQMVKQKELKDRIEVFADELANHLTQNFEKDVNILSQILGPENEQETGMFTNYYWLMPVAKYVEKYGLDYFAVSMNAIEEITKRNTGEYAIRPFIESDTKRTLSRMEQWSMDSNKHVRRLASEGGRPRLPWARKLDQFVDNPSPLIPILNNLKDDKSKYVQKSVANCLNDILKDNQEVGIRIIESWNKGKLTKERKWIMKHSLRNLIKNDDKWAKDILI